jgi:hypothetical protein
LTQYTASKADFDTLIQYVGNTAATAEYVDAIIKRIKVDNTTYDDSYYLNNTLEYM